jgi:hypothetical protein
LLHLFALEIAGLFGALFFPIGLHRQVLADPAHVLDRAGLGLR